MTSPHDTLVKVVLSAPDKAAEFFRRFLPPAILAQLNLATLTVVEATYIDEAFGERQSDMLYEVQSTDGEEVMVFLAFEHQSTPDVMMPWRMLRYVVQAWDGWTKRNPTARKLPPVLPFLLSQVEGGWRSPRTLREVVAGSDHLKSCLEPYLPQLEMLVEDIMLRPIDELRSPTVMGMTLMSLRFARQPGVAVLSATWRPEWGAVHVETATTGAYSLSWSRLFVEYLLRVDDTTTAKALSTALESIDADLAEVPMGYLDRFEAQVREEARAEGRAEGVHAGKAQGQLKLVSRQLALKFGELDAATTARLASASSEQLEAYALRVLTADSLSEVLAE